MKDFKNLFTQAKKARDELIEHVNISCQESAKKEHSRDQKMVEAGKRDAEKIFCNSNNKLVEECLDDFLIMLEVVECELPFERNSTSKLIWNELYKNEDYRYSFEDTAKNIILGSLKENTPEFCNFNVGVKVEVEPDLFCTSENNSVAYLGVIVSMNFNS